VVAVSIPVMRVNSAVELKIPHTLNPPPAAISWLVTSVFWVGSAGVIALLIIVALLVPRLAAIRWTAVAAVVTWGVCLLVGQVLGPSQAARPPVRWPGWTRDIGDAARGHDRRGGPPHCPT
jgi:hypothetical protein